MTHENFTFHAIYHFIGFCLLVRYDYRQTNTQTCKQTHRHIQTHNHRQINEQAHRDTHHPVVFPVDYVIHLVQSIELELQSQEEDL